MIRALLDLGRSPLVRRLIAGVILVFGALIAAFARHDGKPDGFTLASHLVMAMMALVILHIRWKRRERVAITPAKARDIFS